MAKVTMTILRPGIYTTRQGVYEVTASRMRRYADQFARMQSLGIKIPVAWGHQPDAVPADAHDLASREYYGSKFNAGYLDDVHVDPATSELVAVADIPGAETADGKLVTWTELPDGRRIQCGIGEVSIRVDDWRDGQGRQWKDSLIHLALTPFPVMTEQQGFIPVPTSGPFGSGVSLSLAAYDCAAERAPTGGITLNGHFYPGGRFIPSKELEKASESEKKAIQDAKYGRREKLKQSVNLDRATMESQLAPHAHELSPQDQPSAKRLWASLVDHHGDLALHRLQQMVQADVKALENLPAEGIKSDRLRRRVAAYGAVLKMADQHAAAQEPWKGGTIDHGKVYNVHLDHLHADPVRFQFKLNTDQSGVTEELKSVKTFNPDFAGTLSVWRDPTDGRTYVVNGHHRYELATRTGHPNLAVKYIQAKDAKEARAAGALINIAEGRGTAIDAAKFMRDMNVGPKELEPYGVSLKGKLASDAVILTNLSDSAFDRVTRGTLEPAKAMAVAKHLDNHELQGQLFRLLDKQEEKGKDLSPKVIEEMAREMSTTPTTITKESSLFGDMESEESLFVPRNELKAHVRGELSREMNDFLAVASKRRAERVGKIGNVLDTEANKQIAEESERIRNAFDLLANRKGAISDALNQGAATYAAAKTKKARDDARAKTFQAVRDAVFAEVGIGRATEPGSETSGIHRSEANLGQHANRETSTAHPGRRSAIQVGVGPVDSGSKLSTQSNRIERRGHSLATNGAIHMAETKADDKNTDQEDDELFSDADVVGEDTDTTKETEAVDQTADAAQETVVVADDPQVKMVAGIVADLVRLGVVLPADTTPANFMERFSSALKTAIHHKQQIETAEAEVDTEAQAEQAAGTEQAAATTEQVVEEQRPIVMSINDCRTPLERSLLAREENRVRKNKLLQIDRLVKRGMPVAEADKLRKVVSGYQLSLKQDGTPTQRTVDIKLATWDMALPGEKFTEEFLLSNVREEPRPGDHDDAIAMKKDIEERAARVSRKVAR